MGYCSFILIGSVYSSPTQFWASPHTNFCNFLHSRSIIFTPTLPQTYPFPIYLSFSLLPIPPHGTRDPRPVVFVAPPPPSVSPPPSPFASPADAGGLGSADADHPAPSPYPTASCRRRRLLQLRPHRRRGAPALTWPQPPASLARADGTLAARRTATSTGPSCHRRPSL
jgi:hypothetical protein